jgi:hypothetical protein
MENLSDDVLLKIYKFKHNLEFHDVMEELLQFKLYCHFRISLKQARQMVFVHNLLKIQSVDLSALSASSKDILNQIKII